MDSPRESLATICATKPVDERLARLSGLGDQLEALSQTVDFEVFRPGL